MRLLFKGGTVVTGKGPRRADILVEGEKILDVCRDIPAIGAQVVDVTGMLLFPGFIDAHTHFDLDVCNTTTADDFASGSRAALRGGTTTIIDFACPNKGETLHDGLRLWHEKADGKCACDYGFHMTIDDWNETIEREIDDMYAEGISSFKMYMTYPAMMIGDEAMYKALKKLKEKGGICGVHCENAGVIDALIAEKKAAGENGVHCHPETRPDIMEAEAVGRLLRIAEQVDVLGPGQPLAEMPALQSRIVLKTVIEVAVGIIPQRIASLPDLVLSPAVEVIAAPKSAFVSSQPRVALDDRQFFQCVFHRCLALSLSDTKVRQISQNGQYIRRFYHIFV